jgi:hypothetical protein
MAEERFDEKEEEKRNEKVIDEKDRQDPLSAVSFAAFLIWAGVVLLLNNLGTLSVLIDYVNGLNLPRTELPFTLPFINLDAWRVFFLGAGVIVMIEIVIRLLVPMYRRPIVGSILWAGILFSLALGAWQVIWPLVIIALGLSILIRGILR